MGYCGDITGHVPGAHWVDMAGRILQDTNPHVKDTPEGLQSLFLLMFPYLSQAQMHLHDTVSFLP